MKSAIHAISFKTIQSLPAASLGRFGLCWLCFWLAAPVAGKAATIWNGPLITFTQAAPYPNPPGDRDQLTPDVSLTRASTSGLFNGVSETFYTKPTSPADTEWAVGNLADYATLSYTTWQGAGDGNPVFNLPGQQLVLHLISDDIYLSVKFTALGGEGAGGFSYLRSTPAAANIPPSVSIIYPVNGAVFAAPATLTIQASASDLDGTVTNVQFRIGSTILTNEAGAPFAVTAKNLPAGTYPLSAIATDNGGLTATNSVSISVVIPPALTVKVNPGESGSPAPNSVILMWPTNGAGFTLESATTLQPLTIWTPVPNAPVVINGQYTVTNISSGTQQFFHLANFGVSPEFNQPNNVLIADQWNNRVIETTPSGAIVWSYGLGPNDFSASSPISVNDAERVGDYTLMANPGDAPGVIPQTPDGTADNRVLLVDPTGKIVWQYGQFGQAGDGPNLLNTPVQSTFVAGFNVLITDQGNNRVIEVNYNQEIVWQYPGGDTNEADQLDAPNSAEMLPNGHVLIADQGNSRALEVTSTGEIVNTFSAGGTVNTLAFASRLANGDTLLTDSGNARIVEVDAHDQVVWQYYTTNSASTDGVGDLSVAAPEPTRAIRLANGDTLISDQLNNRVIRVASSGNIVADYGLPLPPDGYTFSGGSAGILIGVNVGYSLFTTQGGLYSPYDAKIIGDYTGITPPQNK